MQDIWNLCVAPGVLPYSVFLGVIVVYWLVVIVGIIDMDAFDLDIGAEGDALDTDIDVGGGGFGAALLSFINVGYVPLTAVLSAMGWSLWACAATLHLVAEIESGWIHALLFIPNLVISVFVAKVVTWPLRPVFQKLRSGTSEHRSLVGQPCVIKSLRASSDFGQAEVSTEGAPLLINVKTMDDSVLDQGREAVIVDYDEAANTYLVASLELEK